MKVLFVCTGNSCRSPMAAALLKKAAQEKNLNIDVDSCGVTAFSGMGASREAIDVLRRVGIDIFGHKSKPLNEELINWADLILVMEKGHKNRVLKDWPEAGNKVFLLTEFAKSEEKDIIDPVGKPSEVYEGLLMDLTFYLNRIIDRIENENSNSK